MSKKIFSWVLVFFMMFTLSTFEVTADVASAAPVLQSAATNTTGTKVILTFDKAMDDPSGEYGNFTVKFNGYSNGTLSGTTTNAVTAAALDNQDNAKIELTVTTAIKRDEVITVSYTPGTVVSADAGVLAAFTDQTVTNSVPVVITSNLTGSWVAYDHIGNWGEISYPSGNDAKGTAYNRHISVAEGEGGTEVTFYGYGAPGYKDFLYFNSQEVTPSMRFTFTLDTSAVNYHSMEGGGFIFNSKVESGNLYGYCLLVTQTQFKLYKINGVNLNSFHNETSTPIGSYSNVTTVGTYTLPVSLIHSIVLETTETVVNMWDNGTQIMENVSLPTVYGKNVGMIAGYASHGCSALSIFTFKNLQVKGVVSLTAQLNEAGTQANLSFNTAEGATSVVIEQSTDGVNFVPATVTEAPLDSTSTSATVTGLTQSTTYYFRAVVTDGKFDGTSPSTIAEYIKEVSNLDAQGADQKANLTFSAPSGAVTVRIEQSTNGTTYTTSTLQNAINATSTSATVTGLTNGTLYYFRMVSVGITRNVTSNVDTATPGNVPDAPTIDTVTTGNAQANVSFTPPISNGGSAITGYSVHVYLNGVLQDILTTSGNSSPITVTGLTNGNTYTFKVIATNAIGNSAESAESDAGTPLSVSDAPTIGTATAGNGKAVVTFTTPESDGGSAIIGYSVHVYKNGVLQGDLTKNGLSSPITVTGLTNGNAYTFKVIATNAIGDSNESSATGPLTPSAPVKVLSFTPTPIPTATPVPTPVPEPTKNLLSEISISGDGLSTTAIKDQGPEPKYTDVKVGILVDGEKKADTAKANVEMIENKVVVTVVVDKEAAMEKIEKAEKVVTIPVTGELDTFNVEMNGDMIKKVEDKKATIEIKTDTASYAIPASEIKIDSVAKQLGQNVALKDLDIKVIIEKSSQETAKIVENTGKNNGFSVVAPPVDFSVTVSSGKQKVELDRFNAYVERTVLIPENIDHTKITTGIVLDPDGTARHVPTKVEIIDGKYYAKINSMTNSTYSVVWHPIEYKDVADHWAKDNVNDMGSRMVISGISDEIFEPNKEITRAEFAAVIVKGLGLKPGDGDQTFTDLDKTNAYYDYIKTATSYNILRGFEDGTFRPMEKITREQAIVIIANAMKITGLKVELQDEEINQVLADYDDGKNAAAWAKESIVKSIESGIIRGRKWKILDLKENITRAEVATILRNLLQKSGLI